MHKIIQKFQSLEILKERATKQNTNFLNHLIKYYAQWLQMSNFRCKSHVQEIILPKNMFGCPLKLILRFSGIFCIFSIKLKYSYTIMYECEKKLLTHALSYIGLFNFFHLSLFHVNVICKK